jgi:hypothetical protein
MLRQPITNLPLDPAGKTELQRLAARRGVTLGEASRKGVRLYLEPKRGVTGKGL